MRKPATCRQVLHPAAIGLLPKKDCRTYLHHSTPQHIAIVVLLWQLTRTLLCPPTPLSTHSCLLTGLLEDKRRYQAWMRSRRTEIEQGQGLTPAVFKSLGSNTQPAAAAAAVAKGQQQQQSGAGLAASSNHSSGRACESSSTGPQVKFDAAT